MTDQLLAELQGKFSSVQSRESIDCPAFNVSADEIVEVCRWLRDKKGFDLLQDVTAVDWENESPRFTVVYHIGSTTKPEYVRLAVNCPSDEQPKVPSVTPVWAGANWHERETFDMFGIRFAGHPDLRRILMWDSYPYFPLRKEFPLAGIETELPDVEIGELTGATLTEAPMMGGPFVSEPSGKLSESEPRGIDESWTEKRPKPEKGS